MSPLCAHRSATAGQPHPPIGPALLVRHRLGGGGSPSKVPALSKHRASKWSALSLSKGPALSLSKGFTIVEVMMASVILVVGFIGMIQGITIGSEMLATARRQTLAAQILNHESEKLRVASWATISGYAAGPTTLSIDSMFNYSITACGLTSSDINLTRTTTDLISGELRAVNFTFTWSKSGSSTAAVAATGSWLNQLAFYRPSSIARTYTRKMSAYCSKYGLSLNTQR